MIKRPQDSLIVTETARPRPRPVGLPGENGEIAALLRQAAGLEKGASTSGREQVGTVTGAQVEEIATIKLPDLNTADLEAAKRQVAGTARSMGIAVSG